MDEPPVPDVPNVPSPVAPCAPKSPGVDVLSRRKFPVNDQVFSLPSSWSFAECCFHCCNCSPTKSCCRDVQSESHSRSSDPCRYNDRQSGCSYVLLSCGGRVDPRTIEPMLNPRRNIGNQVITPRPRKQTRISSATEFPLLRITDWTPFSADSAISVMKSLPAVPDATNEPHGPQSCLTDCHSYEAELDSRVEVGIFVRFTTRSSSGAGNSLRNRRREARGQSAIREKRVRPRQRVCSTRRDFLPNARPRDLSQQKRESRG